MIVGSLQTVRPAERRILFEDSRLETDPVDSPAVGQVPIFVRPEVLEDLAGRVKAGAEGGGGAPGAGGLILGTYWIGNGVEFLEVDGFTGGAISAAAAGARGAGPASMPLPAAAWEKALVDATERFPDSLGLGWWRARPGGLALRPDERRFHRRFFPLSWNIALVADPASGSVAFHQWVQSRLDESGYFVVRPRRG